MTDQENAGWPWPLVKSLSDPYYYTIGLNDGTVIHFTSAKATSSPEWVTIDEEGLTVIGPLHEQVAAVQKRVGNATFARGLVVRVSEIVWALDGYE